MEKDKKVIIVSHGNMAGAQIARVLLEKQSIKVEVVDEHQSVDWDEVSKLNIYEPYAYTERPHSDKPRKNINCNKGHTYGTVYEGEEGVKPLNLRCTICGFTPTNNIYKKPV